VISRAAGVPPAFCHSRARGNPEVQSAIRNFLNRQSAIANRKFISHSFSEVRIGHLPAVAFNKDGQSRSTGIFARDFSCRGRPARVLSFPRTRESRGSIRNPKFLKSAIANGYFLTNIPKKLCFYPKMIQSSHAPGPDILPFCAELHHQQDI